MSTNLENFPARRLDPSTFPGDISIAAYVGFLVPTTKLIILTT